MTEIEAEADETPPRPKRRWVRPTLAGFAGVVGVLAMTAGVIGLWGVRVATDSEAFEHQIETLLQREDVSTSLAQRVVAGVAERIDLQGQVDEALSGASRLQQANDALFEAIRSWAEDELAELIRSDEVSENVAAAAGAAHAAAVDLLEGEGLVEGVTVQEGEVRLNLLPLVSRVLTALQRFGLYPDVDVPQFDRSGDPDEQRAELSAALGRELPADFGEPVVYSSDRLEQASGWVRMAQQALVIAIRAAWVFLVAGAVLLVVALVLARNRLRAAAIAATGALILLIVVHVVVDRVRVRAPDLVASPGAKVVTSEVLGSLETSLSRTLLGFVVVLSVVLFTVGAITYRRSAHE